jgi:hypothetical protein
MATILILNQVIFSFEKTDEGEFSQPPAPWFLGLIRSLHVFSSFVHSLHNRLLMVGTRHVQRVHLSEPRPWIMNDSFGSMGGDRSKEAQKKANITCEQVCIYMYMHTYVSRYVCIYAYMYNAHYACVEGHPWHPCLRHGPQLHHSMSLKSTDPIRSDLTRIHHCCTISD